MKSKKINMNALAHLYVQCAIKNTIFSLANFQGQLYKQWSSQSLKKKESKKNTPHNILIITYKIKKYMAFKRIKFLKIFIKGPGIGRYNIVKNFISKKFKIILVFENTNIPYNGCRQPKQKRR